VRGADASPGALQEGDRKLKDPAPDGKIHKLEFLCDGQQFVVSGIHPDTGQAYRWKDFDLTKIDVTHLPIATEARVDAFLDHCVAELKAKMGWLDVSGVAPDAGPDGVVVELRPAATLDDRLRATEYRGELGINDLVLQLPIERLNASVPVEDVIEELMAAVKTAWQKIPNEDPAKNSWDWNAQRNQIVDSCLGFIAKTCSESPRLIETLPEPLLKKWREIEDRGGSPKLQKRRYWGVEDDGPAKPLPEMEPTPLPTMEPLPEQEKKKVQKIEAIPFKAFNERDLPAREFLFAKHYQRGQGTCSIGQDGAGKSTVSIAEAICMATARNILGEQPVARLRAWLHNADDDSTEMCRRIAAFCRLNKIPMTELEGWLFVTGKDNFKIKVVRGGNGGSVPDRVTIAAIIKTISEQKIDVAIFDPLIHLHAVLENNNTNLAEVAEVFADIASACDCATDIVHHVRKMMNGVNEKEFTSEDSRGGGALRAAVRAMRVYNRMTTSEAEDGGVPTDQRGFYLRVDRGKANYLPPATKSTWFRLQSVTLDNGDDVGAIEPWSYPGQEGGGVEKKADDAFMYLLLSAKHHGNLVGAAPQAADYAPKRFARDKYARDLGLREKHFKLAMERLLDAGRIAIEEVRGEGSNRHARKVIVAVAAIPDAW
jgi:hypothetical protein